MHPWALLSSAGLSLVVAWGALARGAGGAGAPAREQAAAVVAAGHLAEPPQPAGRSEALPFERPGGEELATIERTCKAPSLGRSDPCATFALAPGQSAEIELKEAKDTDGDDHKDEQIHFDAYDLLSKTTPDNFDLKVGGKHTIENKNKGAFDLVIYVRGERLKLERNVRFTYEKK